MALKSKWLFWLLAGFLIFDAGALALVLTAPEAPLGSQKTISSGTALVGGPFTLTRTDGKTVTDQDFRGKWMMVFFGYTSCPDACPTALNNMGVALQKLGQNADKLQPLFITVDPHRDTAETMSAYLESFDSRIIGLTGTQAQIDDVVKRYRVHVKLYTEQGQNYLVDHTSYFYIMGPNGKFVDVIDGGTPGEQLADEIRRLLVETST